MSIPGIHTHEDIAARSEYDIIDILPERYRVKQVMYNTWMLVFSVPIVRSWRGFWSDQSAQRSGLIIFVIFILSIHVMPTKHPFIFIQFETCLFHD